MCELSCSARTHSKAAAASSSFFLLARIKGSISLLSHKREKEKRWFFLDAASSSGFLGKTTWKLSPREEEEEDLFSGSDSEFDCENHHAGKEKVSP